MSKSQLLPPTSENEKTLTYCYNHGLTRSLHCEQSRVSLYHGFQRSYEIVRVVCLSRSCKRLKPARRQTASRNNRKTFYYPCCGQSLFFFRFSKGRARARERCRASPVSCLHSRAWSFACLGRFARRAKKKRDCSQSSSQGTRSRYQPHLMTTLASQKLRLVFLCHNRPLMQIWRTSRSARSSWAKARLVRSFVLIASLSDSRSIQFPSVVFPHEGMR